MKCKIPVGLLFFFFAIQTFVLQTQAQLAQLKVQSNDLQKSIPTPKYFLDSFIDFRRNYMNLVSLNSSVTFSGNESCIVYAFNNNKQNDPKNSLFSVCISSKINSIENGHKEIRETLFFTTDKDSNGRLSTPAGMMLFVRRGKDISLTPKENLFQLILPSIEGSNYYFFSFPDFNISYHAEISSSETKMNFKLDDFQINWFETQNSNEFMKSLQIIFKTTYAPLMARIKADDILFYYSGNVITPASYSNLVVYFARNPLTQMGVAIQNEAISYWGWPNIQDLK